MKIGIMTVHCSANPGASLQAFALYKKFGDLGHDPIIIDYRPAYFTDFMDEQKKHSRKGKDRLKSAILGKRLQLSHDKYISFEKNFYPNKTVRYDTPEELKFNTPHLDAYLCGSDQIWNPGHIHYDGSYFCDFVNDSQAFIVSYAASIGQDRLAEKDMAFLKEKTSRFKSISVREDSAVEVLMKLGRNAIQHIDPTMFYNASFWRNISEPIKKPLPEKYILYYPLQRNPFELVLISELKRKTNLPCIAVENSLLKTKGVNIQVTATSPSQFIWLMDHAEYVVTNSFHGCVFSILLRKRLIPLKNQERNSRIESLFRLVDLDGFQTDSIEDFHGKEWERYWDQFNEAQGVICGEKKRGELYLKDCFSDNSDS